LRRGYLALVGTALWSGWDPNWYCSRDALYLQGSAGDDFVALGGDGFALNRDGDLDLAVTPHPEVDPIQAGPDVRIVGDAGADEITAQGGSGAGAPYRGYYGLEVWGGPQSDFSWDDGPNQLTGGEGPDRLNGGIGVATSSPARAATTACSARCATTPCPGARARTRSSATTASTR
jgi:hypothetical protein